MSLAEKLASRIADRPGRTLVLTLLLALVAIPLASRLRIDTDLLAMLPEGSPAARGYAEFQHRFGGFEKVFIVVTSAATLDPEQRAGALIDAADRLAEQLANSPEVGLVRSGLEPEDERFFLDQVVPRAALLLGDRGPNELATRTTPAALAQRAAQLRALLRTPAGAARAPLLRRDPLGLIEQLGGLDLDGLPIDPLSGAFLSADGSASLVSLTPARAEIDPAGGRALIATLDEAYTVVREAADIDLQFAAVGGPLYAAWDEQLLRGDLERTISGSLIGCGLLLVIAFEGLAVALAATAALLVGLLWTAATLGLADGQLTAISLGFAAVLVGLGIDYAIHGATRYRQERLAGASARNALIAVFRHCGPPILTSALTTAAAFAVLGLGHFRPLRELGLLVAPGIVWVLIATATLGAALLVSATKRRGRPRGLLWRGLGWLVEQTVKLAIGRAKTVLVLTALVSLLALWGLGRLHLDAGLSALRPSNHPLHQAERLLEHHFGLGADTLTVVVPGEDLDTVLSRAAAVGTSLRRELGPQIELNSPVRWLGDGRSRERLAAFASLDLEHAADTLHRDLAANGLAPAAFADGLDALRALARGEDPVQLSVRHPPWLAELLRQTEEGSWAALRVRLPNGLWPTGPPASWLAELSTLAPGSSVASVPALGNEIRQLATGDLRRLSLFALLLVTGVVAISLKGRWREALLALLPVTLGALWTLGLWSGLGLGIDLGGLAVIPILLGIGIDDGLHAVHGAAARGVPAAVREAGRAMALTTLTTAVGFGSLLLSSVPGLRSGGLLVSLGVIACWVATLLVLPALATVSGWGGGEEHR